MAFLDANLALLDSFRPVTPVITLPSHPSTRPAPCDHSRVPRLLSYDPASIDVLVPPLVRLLARFPLPDSLSLRVQLSLTESWYARPASVRSETELQTQMLSRWLSVLTFGPSAAGRAQGEEQDVEVDDVARSWAGRAPPFDCGLERDNSWLMSLEVKPYKDDVDTENVARDYDSDSDAEAPPELRARQRVPHLGQGSRHGVLSQTFFPTLIRCLLAQDITFSADGEHIQGIPADFEYHDQSDEENMRRVLTQIRYQFCRTILAQGDRGNRFILLSTYRLGVLFTLHPDRITVSRIVRMAGHCNIRKPLGSLTALVWGLSHLPKDEYDVVTIQQVQARPRRPQQAPPPPGRDEGDPRGRGPRRGRRPPGAGTGAEDAGRAGQPQGADDDHGGAGAGTGGAAASDGEARASADDGDVGEHEDSRVSSAVQGAHRVHGGSSIARSRVLSDGSSSTAFSEPTTISTTTTTESAPTSISYTCESAGGSKAPPDHAVHLALAPLPTTSTTPTIPRVHIQFALPFDVGGYPLSTWSTSTSASAASDGLDPKIINIGTYISHHSLQTIASFDPIAHPTSSSAVPPPFLNLVDPANLVVHGYLGIGSMWTVFAGSGPVLADGQVEHYPLAVKVCAPDLYAINGRSRDQVWSRSEVLDGLEHERRALEVIANNACGGLLCPRWYGCWRGESLGLGQVDVCIMQRGEPIDEIDDVDRKNVIDLYTLLHDIGIIHGDVSLSNFCRLPPLSSASSTRGRIALIDFGKSSSRRDPTLPADADVTHDSDTSLSEWEAEAAMEMRCVRHLVEVS